MRDKAIKFIIIFMIFICCIMIIGCKNKKDIISINYKTTLINLVGYAKSAPFSPDPNFYCFLEIPSKSFISDQIVYFILFDDVKFGLGIIYKNVDGKIFLIRDIQHINTEQIESSEDVLSLKINPKVLTNFGFTIRDKNITLNNVECVLFNWHSGGVNFFSFKDFKRGIISVFNYDIEDKYDVKQSGRAIFTEWNKDDNKWPEMKKLMFPIRVLDE